ncbi:MAG: protein kinase [Chloroflexi bacterium]|nr:protein kinase [Chloroflexota bacterium]
MEDLTGRTLLGNYFLESRKGSGKIAEVYKAWDARKSVPVAVKVLRAGKQNGQNFYQYFSHEAELMSHLEHPNIVRFYDFCNDGGIVFIVMDWVEGSNLKEIIQRMHTPFNLETALVVMKPVASALNYAHTQKIIHCDVKPANILINQNSKVLLTDFGISKQASQRTMGGTPPYMAPEQFTGERLTPQTDIYGLGVTLYEMLSGGQVPYRGDTSQMPSTTLRDRIHWEVMNLPYPELTKYNSAVSESVENAIKKALDKNPTMRFQSVLEFCNVIEQSATKSNISNAENLQNYLAQPKSSSSYPVSEPCPVRSTPNSVIANSQPNGTPCYTKLPRNFRGVFLFAIEGEWTGYFIPIQQASFTIGRSSQNNLILQEKSVSRSHVVIQSTQSGLLIKDMGSKLGTYVNGQLVQGSFRLESGDVIQIGYEQIFEIHFR